MSAIGERPFHHRQTSLSCCTLKDPLLPQESWRPGMEIEQERPTNENGKHVHQQQPKTGAAICHWDHLPPPISGSAPSSKRRRIEGEIAFPSTFAFGRKDWLIDVDESSLTLTPPPPHVPRQPSKLALGGIVSPSSPLLSQGGCAPLVSLTPPDNVLHLNSSSAVAGPAELGLSGEWWKLPSVPKTQPCQQQISAQTILGARTANTACSGRASQLGGYVYCHVCNARIQSAKARGTSGQADPTPCQSSAWSSSLSAPRRDYPQQNSLLSYFPVQRSRGDQKHRLGQYQISELNPGASPNLSCHPCEHCERPTCTSCSSTCESCQREYCTFCSTTSYAASFERKLCLECKKDENAAFMGDAMDLELD